MMREGASPATKADLAARGEALRTEMATPGETLRSETSDLCTALRSEMRDGYLRLSAQLERGQNERRLMEERLMRRMEDLHSQILEAIEAIVGKAQNSERAMVLHGRELTEVRVGLKDHERRIAALEARTDS